MSVFAETILKNKYAHTKPSGRKESWGEVATRVARSVVEPYMPHLTERVRVLIEERKLMPGGRYLYAAGRPYPQCNNCFLFRAADARDGPAGWADTMRCVTSALMTGGGVGVVYSDLRAEGSLVAKMGGKSTGPLALMRMVNEAGRYIMQGGSRRSAIWAGLHWNHPDVFAFVGMKRLDTEIGRMIRECRAKDFNFPSPMDGTNISVILDDDFFAAYADERWSRAYSLAGDAYSVNHTWAREVYRLVVEGMCRDGEPGFSVDTGPRARENLRNAPVVGATNVYTNEGYRPVSEIVGVPVTLWTGLRWARDVVFRKTGENVPTVRVEMTDGKSITCDPSHPFLTYAAPAGDRYRVPAGEMKEGVVLISKRAEDIRVRSVSPAEAADVYCCDVKLEEHSFCAEGVIISNCTEVTSSDNLDMCNLLSLNLARIRTREEFADAVFAGVAFLLCGTLYSPLPIPEMYPVREKNRRLGLGLMGVHEWLLRRGCRYGMCDELREWMEVYAGSGRVAADLAGRLGVSRPVATRSVAPTGTISIVAETTSGVEPIFASGFLRRYLDGARWKAQYVVDATARRLIEGGVDPALVEDAYTLAEDVSRRVEFQVEMQRYVDHGISSTINLPPWGSSVNNPTTLARFGAALHPLLPSLRGITAYPDGARGGQPLNRVPYTEAVKHLGVEFDISQEYTGQVSPTSSPTPPAAAPSGPVASAVASADPSGATPVDGAPRSALFGSLPPVSPTPSLNGHSPPANGTPNSGDPPADGGAGRPSALPSEVDSAHAAALDSGGETCRGGFCSS